ncbi:hypothetical protein L208DRAFT_1166817, partial [Tricholoma matsutake]
DTTLIEVLTEQQALGNQSDSGWKSLAWTAAADKLKGSEKRSGGAPKTAGSCNSRWQTLKGHFIVVKELRGLSGWGWDEDTHMVTAPDGVWEAYIEAHPAAGQWHDESFPLYNNISPLVEGQHATGDHVIQIPGV